MTAQVPAQRHRRRRAGSIALAAMIGVGALLAIAPSAALGATTFVVNRIGDAADNNLADAKCDTSAASGKQCTLRAAIQEANDTPGTDTINFNITSSSKVIAPASPLPPITEQVTINGYSQSGTTANTKAAGSDAVLKIVLDGIGAGVDAIGLDLQASNCIIRGLVIQRFGDSGISIAAANTFILGNFIGTNAAGTLPRGNGTGVSVTGELNFVGGRQPGERNLISGNTSNGVLIDGIDATGNRVQGSYIGTTKSGAVPLGNGGNGVEIGAPNNTVGGTSAGAGNLISGNGGRGVAISDAAAANHGLIQGNFIGADVTGLLDLGNASAGIFVNASEVTIGGTTAAARNVISGNGSDGIFIFGDTAGNVVQGNYIGTNAPGTAALGNDGHGISAYGSNGTVIGGTSAGARNVISGNGHNGIDLFSNTGQVVQGNYIGTKADATGDLGNAGNGVFIFADNNVVGGTVSGAGNLISGNGGNGVYVQITAIGNQVQGNVIRSNDLAGLHVVGENTTISGNVILSNGDDGIQVESFATRVRITANQIFANAGLSIDLLGGTEDAFGVTANDTDDPDTGANNLQNFPVLTTATRSNANGITIVIGTLNSNPSTGFKIELFLAVADSSNHGEAQVLLATKTITTDSGGDKSFSIAVAGLSPGMVLTATATSTIAGNTSEFSLNRTVVAGP